MIKITAVAFKYLCLLALALGFAACGESRAPHPGVNIALNISSNNATAENTARQNQPGKYADRKMLDTVGDYDSPAIIADLLEKARSLDSYAQSFIIFGRAQKRMYFRFSQDGKPFYSFRSEYSAGGQPYVFFYNVDGFDYEYYPGRKTAYRTPSQGNWNESNYERAKDWHFDYKGGKIIGEDTVNGKECYVIHKDKFQTCIAKDSGLKLYLNSAEGTTYYDDFETNLKDELFSPPPFIQIVDKPASADRGSGKEK